MSLNHLLFEVKLAAERESGATVEGGFDEAATLPNYKFADRRCQIYNFGSRSFKLDN